MRHFFLTVGTAPGTTHGLRPAIPITFTIGECLDGFRSLLNVEGKGKRDEIVVVIMQHKGIAVRYAKLAGLFKQLGKVQPRVSHDLLVPGEGGQAVAGGKHHRINVLQPLLLILFTHSLG